MQVLFYLVLGLKVAKGQDLGKVFRHRHAGQVGQL